MSCNAFDGPVRGLGHFAGKSTGPAASDAPVSPRRAGIKGEIEAELMRQGFVTRPLEIGGYIDTGRLAAAIDEKLHG